MAYNVTITNDNKQIYKTEKHRYSKVPAGIPASRTQLLAGPDFKLQNFQQTLKVELCSRDLWLKFYKVGTEMIITKAGSRRMFPAVRVRLSGLQEDAAYCVFLELAALGRRLRFQRAGGFWESCVEDAAPPPSGRPRLVWQHPSSPAPARAWTAGVVAFDQLKLTNTKRPMLRDHIPLKSMHRYVVKIHVILHDIHDEAIFSFKKSSTFLFPETTFIAVTAYQNPEIINLKKALCNYSITKTSSKNIQRYQNPSLHLISEKNIGNFQIGQKHIFNKVINTPPNDNFKYMTTNLCKNFPKTVMDSGKKFSNIDDAEDATIEKPFKNDYSNGGVSQKGMDNGSFFTDFLHKYPNKLPIKFIIPPLHKDLMSDWKQLDGARPTMS